MTSDTKPQSEAQPTDASAEPAREPYVLGTDDLELRRLGVQHALWSAQAAAIWQRAGIAPGGTVLDLGCGPGHATIDLARLVGHHGTVLATDESGPFVETAKAQTVRLGIDNVDARAGDVHNVAEIFADHAGRVTTVYARWLFCFVSDPERVVRQLADLVPAGGRIAVQDYFNYESMTLAPMLESFFPIRAAAAQSWRDRGGDPDIIPRLRAMFRANGFRVTHFDVHVRVAETGSPLWAWPDTFWRSFVPRLVEARYLTEAQASAFLTDWNRISSDPDVFKVLPPVFDLVVERVDGHGAVSRSAGA